MIPFRARCDGGDYSHHHHHHHHLLIFHKLHSGSIRAREIDSRGGCRGEVVWGSAYPLESLVKYPVGCREVWRFTAFGSVKLLVAKAGFITSGFGQVANAWLLKSATQPVQFPT